MITVTFKANNREELEAFLLREGFQPSKQTPSGVVHEWARMEQSLTIPVNAMNRANGVWEK